MSAKSATKSITLTPVTLAVSDIEFANFQSEVNERLSEGYDKGELLHDAIDGHNSDIAAIDDKLTVHGNYISDLANGMNILSDSQHTIHKSLVDAQVILNAQTGVNRDLIDRVNDIGIQVEGLTASHKKLPDFLLMTAVGSAVVTLLILFFVNTMMTPKPQKSIVQPHQTQLKVTK